MPRRPVGFETRRLDVSDRWSIAEKTHNDDFADKQIFRMNDLLAQ